MKARHVWVVFKKEVKDIIRDKKTIITSLLIPMILIPAINLIMGGGVQKMQKDINENVTIALSQNSRTEDIKKLVQERIIKNNPNIKLVDVDNPIDAVRQEKVRAVLEFDRDYAEKMKANKPFTIKIMYDNSRTKSEGAVPILNEAIGKFNDDVVAERLAALGISQDILQPAKTEETNVADVKQSGNSFLAMFIPLLLGILIAVGGIAPATDLVAGEKERNTFEPLLTTKPSRLAILLGKYLTVTLFTFVSIFAIIAGLIFGYLINPNSITMGVSDQIGGFSLPPLATVLVVFITILMGMTFAGIQIALSTYAKSFKEAQTYLSFLMIIAMIPGYATMFMQASDIQAYMYAVPILNTISAFKMILGGVTNYPNLIIALVTSVIYVVLSILLATSMFKKEKVLFRS